MRNNSKVELVPRFLAALVDGVLAGVVGFIPVVGAIIGAVYMLFKDGLFEGQSLGKKVLKLQVVTLDNEKADFVISAKRNAIFALPLAIMIIPILGWLVAPFIALAILIVEVIKIVNDSKGCRFGDEWAKTQVIEFQEAQEVVVDQKIVTKE